MRCSESPAPVVVDQSVSASAALMVEPQAVEAPKPEIFWCASARLTTTSPDVALPPPHVTPPPPAPLPLAPAAPELLAPPVLEPADAPSPLVPATPVAPLLPLTPTTDIPPAALEPAV